MHDKLNVDVVFSKTESSLSVYGSIIAQRPKKRNFTYMTLSIPQNLPHLKAENETASYADEPAEITLWHHRLTHMNY